MSRTRIVNGRVTPLTPQENAVRDAEEAEWAAGAADRAAAELQRAIYPEAIDALFVYVARDPQAPQAVKDYAALIQSRPGRPG